MRRHSRRSTHMLDILMNDKWRKLLGSHFFSVIFGKWDQEIDRKEKGIRKFNSNRPFFSVWYWLKKGFFYAVVLTESRIIPIFWHSEKDKIGNSTRVRDTAKYKNGRRLFQLLFDLFFRCFCFQNENRLVILDEIVNKTEHSKEEEEKLTSDDQMK